MQAAVYHRLNVSLPEGAARQQQTRQDEEEAEGVHMAGMNEGVGTHRFKQGGIKVVLRIRGLQVNLSYPGLRHRARARCSTAGKVETLLSREARNSDKGKSSTAILLDWVRPSHRVHAGGWYLCTSAWDPPIRVVGRKVSNLYVLL